MVLSPSLQHNDQSSALRGLGRFRRRLGTEMCEIVPGLYLGSLRDATDEEQLKRNKIKSIVSVHDLTAIHPLHESLRVFRLPLSDCPSVDIAKHFSETNEFIHSSRLRDENVLVHCLAGVSRSAAVVTAYLLTVTDLSYFSAISLVSARRPLINPNFGFRMQLAKYSEKYVKRERDRLRSSLGAASFDLQFTADKLALQGANRGRSSSATDVFSSSYGSSSPSTGFTSLGRASTYGTVPHKPSLSILQQHRLRRSILASGGGGGAPTGGGGGHRQSHPFVQTFSDMMGRMSFIDD
ncbi:hypothetical protein PRIPAC_92730 [Pristionchus pacificus]|uniref:Uncharacterized protein n=1 Tax=Pristionchus pacificus TaxID=54126 RepID=A0A2A6BIX3_PRIPA|nr:hypothetical protein PRIPAC_92730 [Pristionchus pacificus]|eukprot:PDM65875.1 hypothetical protein PRIPAC_44154 [Pristionchus pacificus]